MAVYMDVMSVAQKRGLSKPYDLAKRMGTTVTSAQRHLNAQDYTQIKFSTLDALCAALECSPCDLIKRVPDAKKGGKK